MHQTSCSALGAVCGVFLAVNKCMHTTGPATKHGKLARQAWQGRRGDDHSDRAEPTKELRAKHLHTCEERCLLRRHRDCLGPGAAVCGTIGAERRDLSLEGEDDVAMPLTAPETQDGEGLLHKIHISTKARPPQSHAYLEGPVDVHAAAVEVRRQG